jgi:hypothetical protein
MEPTPFQTHPPLWFSAEQPELAGTVKEPPVTDVSVILRNFESPDEVREFELGRFELVHIGGTTLGRATYQPGWKWSEHVGPSLGLTRCPVEHVGLVVSGMATAAFEDLDVEAIGVLPGHRHEPRVLDMFCPGLPAAVQRSDLSPRFGLVTPGSGRLP